MVGEQILQVFHLEQFDDGYKEFYVIFIHYCLATVHDFHHTL